MKKNRCNTLQWFQERIGKRIYRANNGCSCLTCRHVKGHGLIIADNLHALYLNDVSREENTAYFDEPVKDSEDNPSTIGFLGVKGDKHLKRELKITSKTCNQQRKPKS